MADFRLFKTAREELEDIWFYTYRAWSEKQANKYINQLYTCFQELADRERPWRKLPPELCIPADVRQNVYFHHEKRHYIFFRELANGDIGIISILHDAMEIPVRLGEDLEKIKES